MGACAARRLQTAQLRRQLPGGARPVCVLTIDWLHALLLLSCRLGIDVRHLWGMTELSPVSAAAFLGGWQGLCPCFWVALQPPALVAASFTSARFVHDVMHTAQLDSSDPNMSICMPCLRLPHVQLGTLGTLTLPQIGDGLSKDEVITIKARKGVHASDKGTHTEMSHS